jgi:hypothetical protein
LESDGTSERPDWIPDRSGQATNRRDLDQDQSLDLDPGPDLLDPDLDLMGDRRD